MGYVRACALCEVQWEVIVRKDGKGNEPIGGRGGARNAQWHLEKEQVLRVVGVCGLILVRNGEPQWREGCPNTSQPSLKKNASIF